MDETAGESTVMARRAPFLFVDASEIELADGWAAEESFFSWRDVKTEANRRIGQRGQRDMSSGSGG